MKKMPKKYKRLRKQEDGSEGALLLKSIFGAFLLTLALGGGLLLLCTLVLSFTPDPLSLALPAGLFAVR